MNRKDRRIIESVFFMGGLIGILSVCGALLGMACNLLFGTRLDLKDFGFAFMVVGAAVYFTARICFKYDVLRG
jgi:hypothetical protein